MNDSDQFIVECESVAPNQTVPEEYQYFWEVLTELTVVQLVSVSWAVCLLH